MFERNATTDTAPAEPVTKKRRDHWIKVSIFANVFFVLLLVAGVGGGVVIHQSDTNPEFCASCHVMQSNVDSYLNSDNLDHIHAEAGVGCKDCHSDYDIPDEIRSGVNFVTGNYEADENGELLQRDFGDEICSQCHGTREEMEVKTDFLYYNPHFARMGIFPCATCHVSHGEQIDHCGSCHINGGQRMIGDTTPRREVIGESIRPVTGGFASD